MKMHVMYYFAENIDKTLKRLKWFDAAFTYMVWLEIVHDS